MVKRILFILKRYPQISETYIHEEIASVRKTHPTKIVSLYNVDKQRSNHYEYQLVAFEAANFVDVMDQVVNDFQPDVLHTHYMVMLPSSLVNPQSLSIFLLL